jgi:hypothetical protein
MFSLMQNSCSVSAMCEGNNNSVEVSSGWSHWYVMSLSHRYYGLDSDG